MFQGSIPSELRSMVHEHAADWTGDVYVGCSGNYTIERVLQPKGFALHSNDVQAWSCAIGWHLAGQPVPFALKPEQYFHLDWLEPYLDNGVGTLATLMLGSNFLAHRESCDNLYHVRIFEGYKRQWGRLHAETVKKIQDNPLALSSFSAMDVRDYLRDVAPAEAPVVMFPPFWAGGYEKMFAALDEVFEWPKPTYPELDEAGNDEIVDLVVDRPRWVLGLRKERPALHKHMRGFLETRGGVPIYVYARSSSTRIARPRREVAQTPLPKISPADDIGSHMGLVQLTSTQFDGLRSQFMGKGILPATPVASFAVTVDGKVVGAFGYESPRYFDLYAVFLLSDFAVSWSKYRRLSKLVVIAAMSREAQLLAQRTMSKRILRLASVAYTNNATSAKYGRGIPGFTLRKRTENKETKGDDRAAEAAHTRYNLLYCGPMGKWTLDQGLEIWHQRHASDRRKP